VTAVVSVAVYVVLFARGADGVNVTVAPFTEIVPVTPPTVNEDAVTLAGATASLNVAVTAAPTATPVALLAGAVELTVGEVVSAAAGLSAASPGNVSAVISARLVDPSPSESLFASAELNVWFPIEEEAKSDPNELRGPVPVGWQSTHESIRVPTAAG
jgi:hypothetical protein